MSARNALNRSSYVAAALEVIGEVGVDKLSMRNVAARLNVSPMAMYKHFPTKDALLAASLEEFIVRANVVPDDGLEWEPWIEEAARGMYQALCEELSWVPLLGSLRVGAQAIAVTQAFVTKLCHAGFSVDQSLRAYFAIIQVVVGAVCLRSSLDSRLLPGVGPAVGAISDSSDTSLELATFLRLDQIEIGLPLVIAALKTQRAELKT